MLTTLAHYRHSRIQSPVQAAIAWINCWPSPKKLRCFPEYNAYWEGASEAARKLGYHLEEFIVNKDLPLRRLEQILLTRNIKGILVPPHHVEPNWEDFNWGSFSAVRLSRTIKGPKLHVITSDQAANAMLAFREIRRKGYERIGYVVSNESAWMFANSLMQAQLEISEKHRLPPLLFSGEKLKDPALFLNWMKKCNPQAIITSLDDLPEILKAHRYSVPKDVALAGLSLTHRNISAGVDPNSKEIGRMGVLTVISLINDFEEGIPLIAHQLLVEGRWIDGPSMPSLQRFKLGK